MGLVGGTAVGLVTSKRSRESRSRSSAGRKSSAKLRRRADLERTRRLDRKPSVDSQLSLFRESRKTPVQGMLPSPSSSIISHSTASQETIDVKVTPRILDQAANVPAYSACPCCGLETSNLLMSEHFLSSPSHRFGQKDLVEEQEGKTGFLEQETLTAEEHSSGVMRNLLSMLAPPRAFGRRHLQQNENPFSELIQRRMQVGPSNVPKTLTVLLDN